MTLKIIRRRLLVILAACVAFVPSGPGRAGNEMPEIAAKYEDLVIRANDLARKLTPILDGSSKDLRPWIDGDGYKELVSFAGETERIARAMTDFEKTAKIGAKLTRLGAALKSNLADLSMAKRPGRTKYVLKETYQLLKQFEEIKVTY